MAVDTFLVILAFIFTVVVELILFMSGVGWIALSKRKAEDILVGIIFLCGVVAIELAHWAGGLNIGNPLTSIAKGNYTVVSVAEVSKDKQQYYQMVLEQAGAVKLYTLPRDMVVVATSAERQHTLEVVGKAGLIKATLYNDPAGSIPSR